MKRIFSRFFKALCDVVLIITPGLFGFIFASVYFKIEPSHYIKWFTIIMSGICISTIVYRSGLFRQEFFKKLQFNDLKEFLMVIKSLFDKK